MKDYFVNTLFLWTVYEAGIVLYIETCFFADNGKDSFCFTEWIGSNGKKDRKSAR